jgi:hypothetical protein
VRIVGRIRRRAGYRDGLEDFSGQVPGCHPTSRQS